WASGKRPQIRSASARLFAATAALKPSMVGAAGAAPVAAAAGGAVVVAAGVVAVTGADAGLVDAWGAVPALGSVASWCVLASPPAASFGVAGVGALAAGGAGCLIAGFGAAPPGA